MIKSIGIFCGSSLGNKPEFIEKAKELGRVLVEKKITLVYGGASVGLMKIISQEMMKLGGHVIGVLSKHIAEMEIAENNISKLHIVNSMSDRKKLIIELSDAFIAMPGGVGTLDELFESIVLSQLRIVDKACGILNINGYYDFLLKFLDNAVKNGFIRQEHRDNFFVDEDSEGLIKKLHSFKAVEVGKWINDIVLETEVEPPLIK